MFNVVFYTVAAIIALSVIATVYQAINNPNVSVGINGMVEHRCISGFEFIIGESGRPTQILNEFGKGVPCN